MNRKEQSRLLVLNRVMGGQETARGASEVLGISLRQVRRLLAAYKQQGAAALAHGNRGRKPRWALGEGVKARVVELACSRYEGCNVQHLTELLIEREGIVLSRSSVRRILLEAGMGRPRPRQAPGHRQRRERRFQEGMLVQADGSEHAWLQERGPKLSLVGAIDDATGKVLGAIFRPQEDSLGYFLVMQQVVKDYGIPLALYHDRHSIFELPARQVPSLEEQLEGERRLTQFGRLLAELGISSISSHSPQARGRIERLWGTFQDRLVSELRLAQASTEDEANAVLQVFLPRFNQRFAVPAAEPGSAFNPVEKGWPLEEVFCFKHERVVGLDNVVRFEHHRLQVLPCHGRQSYARARVKVHQDLEGNLGVFYQSKRLLTQVAPLEAPSLRGKVAPVAPLALSSPAPRPTSIPAANHPWRRASISSGVTFSQNS